MKKTRTVTSITSITQTSNGDCPEDAAFNTKINAKAPPESHLLRSKSCRITSVKTSANPLKIAEFNVDKSWANGVRPPINN